jgi:hypothetical protein
MPVKSRAIIRVNHDSKRLRHVMVKRIRATYKKKWQRATVR